MSAKPMVSVLMPVFNGERFLRESVESILNQTFRDYEFIIINDGSTDSSEKIIFECSDDRIVYHRNSSNLGLIKTLNLGLSMARGEYIARMDADDIAKLNRLELQLKGIKASDADAIGGSIIILGTEDKITYPSNWKTIRSTLLFESPIAHPCLFLRRASLNGLSYHESYEFAEDYKFFADLGCRGKLSNVSDVILEYRKHDDQVSEKKFNLQKVTHTKIVGELLSEEFKLIINEDIFSKLFRYERLNFIELRHIVKVYSAAAWKALFRRDYDSFYIFKRLMRLIFSHKRAVWNFLNAR